MSFAETCFWLCAAGVLYTYIVYPLCLALWAKLGRAPLVPRDPTPPSVSIIVAAYNETATIGRRVEELAGLIAEAGLDGEVIVVSDGSTDGTARAARAAARGSVLVLELPANVGKAAAMTRGGAAARYDLLVFADARQSWAPDALRRLLENFADPSVGAASGDLVVEAQPGVMGGVGFYWHFEKWLRKQEGRVHSSVGVTGAISAVRRELFPPVPPGTLIDDVYWPLVVVMRGFRVIHDARAVAYDRLPERARDEFRRKVRTLSGNFQLLTLLPSAFCPWRNPIWLQLVSHKMMRLLVPWLLAALLAASLLADGPFYRLAFWAQAAFYLAGVGGLWKRVGKRFRPAGIVASFLVLNTAAAIALGVWASGRAARAWSKVTYRQVALDLPRERQRRRRGVPIP